MKKLSCLILLSLVLTLPLFGQTKPKRRAKSRPPAVKISDTSNNSKYIRGPRGGCYYISGGGNKIYVSRDLCR